MHRTVECIVTVMYYVWHVLKFSKVMISWTDRKTRPAKLATHLVCLSCNRDCSFWMSRCITLYSVTKWSLRIRAVIYRHLAVDGTSHLVPVRPVWWRWEQATFRRKPVYHFCPHAAGLSVQIIISVWVNTCTAKRNYIVRINCSTFHCSEEARGGENESTKESVFSRE